MMGDLDYFVSINRGYYMPARGYEFYLPVASLFQKRDLLCNHNDGDLFTCEDNMLSSRVKI